MAKPREQLSKAARLRRGSDFRRVLRRGVRIDSALFTLWAAPRERERSRLGLAASRRLGGAVERNRAKRLLRESFRRGACPDGFDLVLVPKPAILSRRQIEVDDEWRRSLRRLIGSRKAQPRGTGLPPAR